MLVSLSFSRRESVHYTNQVFCAKLAVHLNIREKKLIIEAFWTNSLKSFVSLCFCPPVVFAQLVSVFPSVPQFT